VHISFDGVVVAPADLLQNDAHPFLLGFKKTSRQPRLGIQVVPKALLQVGNETLEMLVNRDNLRHGV
jgi:hypothetical protein